MTGDIVDNSSILGALLGQVAAIAGAIDADAIEVMASRSEDPRGQRCVAQVCAHSPS